MSVDVNRLFVDTEYMNQVLAETAILMVKSLPTFKQFCDPDDLAFAVVRGRQVVGDSEQYLNQVQQRMQQALDLLKGREAFLVLMKAPFPV
jgi:hypothetical protein